MKLKDCKYGTLVVYQEGDRIGMLIGITNSIPTACFSERQLLQNARHLIQWSGGSTSGIHQKI